MNPGVRKFILVAGLLGLPEGGLPARQAAKDLLLESQTTSVGHPQSSHGGGGHEGTSAEDFEKLAKRAEEALDADRVPEAIRLYDRATKLRPDWSEGWWHLGTLLFDAGRFLDARSLRDC